MSAAHQDDEIRDVHALSCPVWTTHHGACTCRDDAGYAPYLVPEAGSLAARLDLLVPLPCDRDPESAA